MSKRITRRTFIKRAAASGAGLVILSSRSLNTYAANDKLNVGLIGCGGRGSVYSHGYVYNNGSRYNLVALCDVNQSKAQKAYETHPDTPKFYDYRVMLEKMEKEIDAVITAVPDHSHAGASVTAMKHGKHIYCEKPLTRTVYESHFLRRMAKARIGR